jgi:glycosyltransferase involved in cell wall biosynthesis
VPFRSGGAEQLWEGLVQGCRAQGYATELIKLPCREYALADLLDTYCQFSALDLSHFDVVISGKYPAWAIDHPDHVMWMLHPLRGLYDRYPATLATRIPRSIDPSLAAAVHLASRLETLTGSLHDPLLAIRDHIDNAQRRLGPGDPQMAIPSAVARSIIHSIDRACMSHRRVRSFAAISEAVASRAGWFPPDTNVRVVLPPLPSPPAEPALPREPAEGDEGAAPVRFFTVGRLEAPKRIDLAIRAAHVLTTRTSRPVRLRIAGTGAAAEDLRVLAEDLSRTAGTAGPEIEFLGHIDDRQLDEEYRAARAVIFTPDREDFGYVALEAMARSTPVLVANDSGGPLELIEHGVTGWVVEPTPTAIADALLTAAEDPVAVAILGEAAERRAQQVTWPGAVAALLTDIDSTDTAPAILALSTYPVFPRVQGGQLRAWHLLHGLAARGHNVEIVSLTVDSAIAGRRSLGESITETTVLISKSHTDAETQMRLVSGPTAVTDIASSVLWPATTDLSRQALDILDRAECAVLVQPYLAPALVALLGEERVPVVLDAHNVEAELKARMLTRNEGGRWLLDKVRSAEALAIERAGVVVATTEHDAKSLAEHYGVPADRLTIIPNGADVQSVDFVTGHRRFEIGRQCLAELGGGFEHLAIFVGSGHQPNVEAAALLIEAARLLPEVAFALLGRHSEMVARRSLPANVFPLGVVSPERLNEFQAGATVALNPIRSGGGSNLKLTEYFAAGAPVVTTDLGARGIDHPGRLAYLATPDPDSIAAGIRAVIEDPASAQRRAAAARAYAETALDWTRLGERFADAVERTISA